MVGYKKSNKPAISFAYSVLITLFKRDNIVNIDTKPIRIGCASAFWGDTETAAQQLIDHGQLDYLVFDYLAEITMAIMAGQKRKNPEAGFAHDFIHPVMAPLLAKIKAQNIKVISNAGGINPHACAQALAVEAKKQHIDLKIAVVDGDSLSHKQADYQEIALTEMFSGAKMPEKTLSANAYLGVDAIVKALRENADIIITGRIVDSAVVVAPLVYQFNWSMTDYDKLAQASLAGHIIECGTHCTGGNFTDWHMVKSDYAQMGFPIIEVQASSDFTVTKAANTGGLVSCATVAEQIVYEIGDPQHYLLPDVNCDFSQVTLSQIDNNLVAVSGATGNAPSDYYKASFTYLDGYKCSASFLIAGYDAKAKAVAVSDAIIAKTSQLFIQRDIKPYQEVNIELLGTNATYNDQFFSKEKHQLAQLSREVVVKITVAHHNKKALLLFSREIAQAATAMAPGITGLLGGRPTITPKIALFSALVNKDDCQPQVTIDEQSWPVSITTTHQVTVKSKVTEQPLPISEPLTAQLPLIKLAWARSGDKGDHSNIGVIARQESYLKYIEASLTDDAVAEYFSHILTTNSQVTSWRLPGISARNYLLENSLGGGGISSLRIDPQGKAYGQQLLQFPINVPANLANELMTKEE